MYRRVLSVLILICFTMSALGFTASAVSYSNMMIDGPSALLKPVDGSITKVKYTVLDENGDPIDDNLVTWSASGGLYIMPDGGVLLDKDTPNGSYTIEAEYNGGSVPAKTIEIKTGCYLTDVYSSTSGSGGEINMLSGGFNDDCNFEFDFSAPSASSSAAFFLNLLSDSAWHFAMFLRPDSTKYNLRFYDFSGPNYTTKNIDYLTNYTYNTTQTIRIAFDYDENMDYFSTYDVFLNETPINDYQNSAPQPKGTQNFVGIRKLIIRNTISMTNIKIYSGEKISASDPAYKYLGISVSGSDSLGVPRSSTPVTASYDVKNIFGSSLKSEAEWNVTPSDQGVTVSSDGLLEVGNDAQYGIYTLTAQVNGENYVKTVEIIDTPYTLSMVGSEGCVRDHTFDSEAFVFETFDDYDIPVKSTWSLVNPSAGVEISTTSDGKGILTVSSDASDGTYTVKAVALSEENMDTDTATKDFELSSATYSIDGPSSVVVTGSNHHYASYAVKSSLGNVVTQGVTWTSDDIYVLSDGRAVFYAGSPSVSTISATYNSEIYTKGISISTATVADIPEYTGDILYKGTYTMSVGDGINEKLLTATITEGGVPYDKADIIWSLVGVSGNFTGGISDVYVSGSKLYVVGQQSGTITVCAKVKKTDIKQNITITLVDAFTSLNGSNLTIKGSENENIQIKHYMPASGSFIDAVFDISDSYVLSNVTIPAEGTVTLPLDLSLSGMHKIVVENAAHEVNEYNISVNDDKLFYQTDIKTLLTDARINDYLDIYSTADTSMIQKCSLVYAGFDSNNKDKVIQLAEKDIEKYYAAVLTINYLNANESYLTELKSEFSKLSIDLAWIDLLKNDIRQDVISNDMLANVSNLESMLDSYILSGVKTASKSNTKEAMPYLALCNSEKYNNADETAKNLIADAVSGNTYASAPILLEAINAVDISDDTYTTQFGSTQNGTVGGYSPAPAPVNPVVPQNGYNDVSEEHWAYSYINTLSQKNIVNGYDDNKFMPELNVTRAEFVKMLVETFNIPAQGSEPFADVNESDWFSKYLCGAYSAGLVLGDGQNFNPDSAITRQDAAVMIYRFARYYGVSFETGDSSFTDNSEIADYAKDAINALNRSNVINGMPDGTFAPVNNTTRAEAAKMICSAMEKGGIR